MIVVDGWGGVRVMGKLGAGVYARVYDENNLSTPRCQESMGVKGG